MEFVKSNCGWPIGSTGRFAFLVSRRENWLSPQSAYLVCMPYSIVESGTLTTLPPHGTAQVAQSALRWQSRSTRSAVTSASHCLLALALSAFKPQCGRLAHHALPLLTGRLRLLHKRSGGGFGCCRGGAGNQGHFRLTIRSSRPSFAAAMC